MSNSYTSGNTINNMLRKTLKRVRNNNASTMKRAPKKVFRPIMYMRGPSTFSETASNRNALVKNIVEKGQVGDKITGQYNGQQASEKYVIALNKNGNKTLKWTHTNMQWGARRMKRHAHKRRTHKRRL